MCVSVKQSMLSLIQVKRVSYGVFYNLFVYDYIFRYLFSASVY